MFILAPEAPSELVVSEGVGYRALVVGNFGRAQPETESEPRLGFPVGNYKSPGRLHYHAARQRSRVFFLCFMMSKSDEVMPAQHTASKADIETIESIHKPTQTTRGKDKAAELLAANERIVVTSEENKRVLRKIDLIILPILLSVYFLQSLDKTTLSYASVFGLIEDAKLDPNSQQYSWLGSIVYIAQLVMQPLVAFFLVKFPTGKFTGIMVFTWGVILCGMAGTGNFTGLMATRFLLGAFESAVGKSRAQYVLHMY